MIALRRNRIGRDWTAADFDSVEVRIAAGIRRPAARVTQARSPRPVRLAVRAVLRSARSRSPNWPATEPQRSPAN